MNKCTREDCSEPKSGKSKYCKVHKAQAREAWRQMVADKSKQRENRDKEFRDLFNRAADAGFAAAEAITPVPMDVKDPRSGQTWHVPDGVCGFAWVNVRPGNCAFANWLKKNDLARAAYRGGVDIWISAYNQSLQKKETHARAMAKVISEAGITAYASSRMD